MFKPTDPKAEIWFYSNEDAEVVLQIMNSNKEFFSKVIKKTTRFMIYLFQRELLKKLCLEDKKIEMGSS
jgi:hypothetical protein